MLLITPLTDIFIAFGAAGGAIVGAGYGIVKGIRRIRSNAATVAASLETEIQKRISEAIAMETSRIERLHGIAQEWQELAVLKSKKVDQLESTVREQKVQIDELNRKYDQLNQLFIASEQKRHELEVKYMELLNKVEKNG